MKHILILITLLASLGCDIGLESDSDNLAQDAVVDKARRSYESEIAPILGAYSGILLTKHGKKISSAFTIQIFKFTERVNVGGRANFIVRLRALIFFSNANTDIAPGTLRIVDVYYSSNNNEITFVGQPRGGTSNPNFGLFTAIGIFQGNKITLNEVFDHNGQLMPLSLDKVTP